MGITNFHQNLAYVASAPLLAQAAGAIGNTAYNNLNGSFFG